MKYKLLLLKLISLLIINIPLAGTIVQPSLGQSPSDEYSDVDRYVWEVMDRFPIPGMAVAIVRADQILYVQGYGVANQNADPITPETPFMLASVTKSFTALAIQQLALAGKLDLDDPLQQYLPEFKLSDPQASAGITLRQLMEHTSGISQSEGTQPYLHSPGTTFPEALNRLASYKPAFQPGKHYDYSNWNFILLGEVVSRVSGQEYSEYIKESILDPLEMSHATFADYHTIEEAATGHYISFGFPVPYDEKHVPVELSAGYLTASVEDMAHYLIPYFNNGQYSGATLLPDQGNGWYDANWNWKPGVPSDVAYTYSGGHNSFNTGYQLLPAQRLGVVVLMNTRLDMFAPGPAATDIAFGITQLILHSSYTTPSAVPFYVGFLIIDGALLLLAGTVVWQSLHLKHKPEQHIRTDWIGIALNLIVLAVISSIPSLIGSDWAFMLRYRTDVTAAFLAVAVLLAAVTLIKLIRMILMKRTLAIPKTKK